MKITLFDKYGDNILSSGLEILCIRAASNAAANAAGTAGNTAAALGSQAGSELGQLSPFYQREMSAEHMYDPTQINELLTQAGAGAGAATGAAQTGMERQAATTGNASADTKGLQELARDRMKTAAGTSEGIAAQDVMGAKQLNQQGAQGEAGLYGENLKGQLDAMGQVAPDINAEVNANKTGWLQNAEGLAQTGASIASGAGALGYKPGQ
jgi:hypothetical protein